LGSFSVRRASRFVRRTSRFRQAVARGRPLQSRNQVFQFLFLAENIRNLESHLLQALQSSLFSPLPGILEFSDSRLTAGMRISCAATPAVRISVGNAHHSFFKSGNLVTPTHS